MSWGFAAAAAAAVFATVGAALAAALLLWRARGAGRRRRAALVLAIAALLLLFLRPTRPAAAPPERPEPALLLSPGSVGLPALAAPPARIVAVATAMPEAPPAAVEVAPDAAALWRRAEIGALTVAGHGLREFEWPGFAGRLEFLAPPALPLGVADVLWRRNLDLGEPLEVEGRLTGVAAAPEGRLDLVGPGGVEDSVGVETVAGGGVRPGEDLRFRLRARPRAAGTHLYHLELRRGAALVAREPVDVEVVAPPPLRLLVLESAPSFETRHLERWLAASGAVYTLRSRVSRDRFRDAYSGAGAVAPRVAPAELQRVDLLVADPESLAALAPSARRALDDAIQEGLGLLLLPREGLGPWPPTGLRAREVAPAGEARGERAVPEDVEAHALTVRARWPGVAEAPPLAVPSRALELSGAAAPLVEDGAGRALAAVRAAGRGRVAVALLTDTYRWVLEGNAAVHAAYWAHLLGAVARARGGARFETPSGPVLAGEPLAVRLRGAPPDGDPPAAMWLAPGGVAAALALRQDPLDPRLWEGTLWPRPGWNRLEAEGAAAALWGAAAPAWRVVDAARRQRATALRALRADPEPAPGSAHPPPRRELPRWPFYALFLAAVLYLWAGERLRAGW